MIRKKTQWGHSILEVTMSLTIASILILGGLQWFQIVKKTYWQKKTQIMHDNILRNIYLYISQDIQMSKYLGSRAKDPVFPIRHHLISDHVLYRYRLIPNVQMEVSTQNLSLGPLHYKHVSGFTAPFACLNHLPDLLCRRLSPESDVLVIHLIGKRIKRLKQGLAKCDDIIETEGKNHFYKGSLVLIADILQGDLFIANDVSDQRIYHQPTSTGNQSGHLSKCYKNTAEVIELQNVAYYLSGYVLYRDDFLHPAQEMITDIKSFKVAYGILKQGKIQYTQGRDIHEAEWKQVQSVRLKIKTLHRESEFEFEIAMPNRYSALTSPGPNYACFTRGESFVCAIPHCASYRSQLV